MADTMLSKTAAVAFDLRGSTTIVALLNACAAIAAEYKAVNWAREMESISGKEEALRQGFPGWLAEGFVEADALSGTALIDLDVSMGGVDVTIGIGSGALVENAETFNSLSWSNPEKASSHYNLGDAIEDAWSECEYKDDEYVVLEADTALVLGCLLREMWNQLLKRPQATYRCSVKSQGCLYLLWNEAGAPSVTEFDTN